jgi:putative transposase
MKFVFIAKHRTIWPVAWLCDALGVSRSGFHAWLNRSPSARSRSDEAVGQRVKASFVASDRTYGARRVWRDLLAEGVNCGLHRIERLMRLQALRARPRRRRLPKDEGDRQIATVPSNILDRQFAAERPNQKWIADFTYIWTAEGWLYVAAVIDLFSRRVVGWSMSAGMTAQLVADALLMAVWRRGKPNELLHHSDQGRPVHQRAVPTADGRQRHRLQHEPIRQRLGQRGDGELLLVAEDRACRPQNISDKKRGQSGCVRLHRAVLQCDPASFDDRIPQPC